MTDERVTERNRRGGRDPQDQREPRDQDHGQAAREVLSPADRHAAQARMHALRDEIDRLDEQLVRLLSARASCALEIGQLKTLLEMVIYQPSREEAVLRHVRDVNQGPLDDDAIARLFERIIDEARRLERVVHDKE